MNRKLFNQYITEADFRSLFVSEMGWNNPTGATSLPEYSIDEETLNITQIADRNGFQILHCVVEHIPTSSFCKKLDTRLRRNANDYILIFTTPTGLHHLWVVPVKKVEKRDLVMVDYDSVERAEFLFQKMEGLSFELDEKTTISDVIARIQEVFIINSEKLTKDFYAGFKKEHTNFAKFITGIDDQVAEKDNRNKQWYTSVMLNRLMFCYFIQKKGFLDGDVDYLKHKLEWTQRERGEDRFFHSFYKGFLVTLFHGGLNAPKHDNEFEDIYGRIPYLNGGMFDEHQIEHDYANLDIADEAFESLFGFFDKWNWHLDDRITASGRDINPDVLGYIFEQYINDRAQMGAYYTKEDITEYIGRNTIVPYLVEQTLSAEKSSSTKDFWLFLQQSGDRYIYDAVKRGVELPLPDYIEQGVDTTKPGLLERRARWNECTPEEYALPTEIWRETVERRQRYADVSCKIVRGEITSTNDFITYNLDIRQFVYDYLLRTDNHLFIKHFYAALQKVTILDPTCGSGAFLFAALNILEPLYEICISRMQEFAEQNDKLFREELAEIEHRYRSNIQYFIYKSIILRNLYGVDIMVEATEIAKLRLFLKMVAVVDVNPRDPNLGLDPLPDIDFNIRCGNSLVGYATAKDLERDLAEDLNASLKRDKIENEMDIVAHTFRRFKEVQLTQNEDLATFKEAKRELSKRLKSLNSDLNQLLHRTTTGLSYEDWLRSHQPYNWLVEFYEIIHDRGGFDVIIGNPPYLETRQIIYSVQGYETIDSGAVHAFCMERSSILLNQFGIMSMIVPIALVCTQRMKCVQSILEEKRTTWYSNYAWRPAKLFDAVNRALSIFITKSDISNRQFSTPYVKWTSEHRGLLFPTISYTEYSDKRDSFWMPKLTSNLEVSILTKTIKQQTRLLNYLLPSSLIRLYYRTTGGLYWKVFTDFAPRFFCNGVEGHSSRETSICICDKETASSLMAFFSSNLFWWWYTITSNLRDLNPSDLHGIGIPQNTLNSQELIRLGKSYKDDLIKNSVMLTREQKGKGTTQTQSFRIKLSKPIIDEIDKVLAKHYGFTDEELDFIINYDIKYRMGDELNEE